MLRTSQFASVACAVALFATSFSSGCGRNTGPQVAAVSGVVKLNGTPVEGAGVSFEPVQEGRSSFALTDAQGHYVLKYLANKNGALVGDHVVKISKARKALKDDAGKVVDPGVPELFPPTANAQSTLSAKVVKGSNTFDFDVTK